MSDILGPPTVAGYTQFLRDIAGITTSALPDSSQAIQLSFGIAMDLIACVLANIGGDLYTLGVYNLATDRLLHFAPDQAGQTFFANARGSEGYNINSFVPGVIQSSGDEATNQSFAVPEGLKNLSLLDLSALQTPYGVAYLAYAQQIGSLWGLS